jgi:hypothetical protein
MPLGIFKDRKDNFEKHFKYLGREVLDGIELVRVRDRLWTVVNAVIVLPVP